MLHMKYQNSRQRL